MDNSIFLLPTMDEELYADEEIDIENYLLSKGADKEKIENLRKICLTDING